MKKLKAWMLNRKASNPESKPDEIMNSTGIAAWTIISQTSEQAEAIFHSDLPKQ